MAESDRATVSETSRIIYYLSRALKKSNSDLDFLNVIVGHRLLSLEDCGAGDRAVSEVVQRIICRFERIGNDLWMYRNLL